MSILLSDVQVKMSRIGVHTANASTNLYFPTVTIYYTDPKEKPVSTWIIELGSRFKKSDYLGKVICGDFFVILLKTEWDIISPEGKLVTSMSPCGEVVEAEEDHFIVRNGNIFTGYNIKGKAIWCKESVTE